ncbi:hypothetical protein J6590_105546 [Homalodisca vitripennis]|nr:hypothetical protein J6590_105546 [Homalodisca vitripennis]
MENQWPCLLSLLPSAPIKSITSNNSNLLVGILLMYIEGLFDGEAEDVESVAMFGISTAISSYQKQRMENQWPCMLSLLPSAPIKSITSNNSNLLVGILLMYIEGLFDGEAEDGESVAMACLMEKQRMENQWPCLLSLLPSAPIKSVGILLMYIEGLFDEEAEDVESVAMFGISSVINSYQISPIKSITSNNSNLLVGILLMYIEGLFDGEAEDGESVAMSVISTAISSFKSITSNNSNLLVGILLMYIEGLFDGEAEDGESVAMSVISTAISSYQVYNIK